MHALTLSNLFIFIGFDLSVVQFMGCMTLVKMGQLNLSLIGRIPENDMDREIDHKQMERIQGEIMTLMGEYSGMTVHICVQRCWVKRFDYAGLQVLETKCMYKSAILSRLPIIIS